jgi:archaellum component FlaC
LALIGFQNGQVNKLNARIDTLSRSTRKYMEEKTIYVDSNERLMGTNKQLTLQIESLSDTIQKTPNINNKLKKSFDENNKILYEKTSELEQLRIRCTRLTHDVAQ